MDIEANKSQNTTNTEEELCKKRQSFLERHLIPLLMGADDAARYYGEGGTIAYSLLVGAIVAIPLILILSIVRKDSRSLYHSENRTTFFTLGFISLFLVNSMELAGFEKKSDTNSVFLIIIIITSLMELIFFVYEKLLKKLNKKKGK